MRVFLVICILGLLTACSESARDSLDSARQALAGGDSEAALAAAEAGLAAEPGEITTWGLELVKLEALARLGRGDETLAQLAGLAERRPTEVVPDQYAATADQLRAAGQGAAAAQALDQGLQRFPDHPGLTAQIEAVKQSAGEGSDELEMLRSLGYIE